MTTDTDRHNGHSRRTMTRHTWGVTSRHCRQQVFRKHNTDADNMMMNVTRRRPVSGVRQCINKQKQVGEKLNISPWKLWKIASERTDDRSAQNIAKIRHFHNMLIISVLYKTAFHLGFHRLAIWPISDSEIGHITLRKSPYRALKKAFSHSDMGHFANRRTFCRFMVGAKWWFWMPYHGLPSPKSEKMEC